MIKLSKARKQNENDADELGNYAIGFDVPGNVAKMLSRSRNSTITSAANTSDNDNSDIDNIEEESDLNSTLPSTSINRMTHRTEYIYDGPRPRPMQYVKTRSSSLSSVSSDIDMDETDTVELNDENDSVIVLLRVRPKFDENGDEIFQYPCMGHGHGHGQHVKIRSTMCYSNRKCSNCQVLQKIEASVW